MKVLEYIQSLIVPTHMYKRRKINILISLLIMILGIFALSTPIASHLSKMRYETLGEAYDFKVFEYADPEDLLSNPVTDEERSKYNILSFDELKALGVSISAHGINNDDKIEAGKEYVLKANIPVYDNEGSITSYTSYFIHIVFDYGEDTNIYDIEEKFDKLPKENDEFNHFLLVFYEHGFIYRSKYEINNKLSPSMILYNSGIEIEFSLLEKASDISYPIIDMMIPMLRYQYQLRAALYVILFPTIMSLLFSVVLKNTGIIRGFKEYFNLAAVSSIPLLLFCMIASFINVGMANLIFQNYSFIYIIYYFIVVVITNKKPRVE